MCFCLFPLVICHFVVSIDRETQREREREGGIERSLSQLPQLTNVVQVIRVATCCSLMKLASFFWLLDEVHAQISLRLKASDPIFDIPVYFRFYFDLEVFQNFVTISHRSKKMCCARSNLCDNLETFFSARLDLPSRLVR